MHIIYSDMLLLVLVISHSGITEINWFLDVFIAFLISGNFWRKLHARPCAGNVRFVHSKNWDETRVDRVFILRRELVRWPYYFNIHSFPSESDKSSHSKNDFKWSREGRRNYSAPLKYILAKVSIIVSCLW